MSTGTEQCAIFSVSATAKAWFSQCTCVYIYINSAYIDGSILKPWHLRYTEMQFLVCRYPQASRNPTFQHSNIPAIQKSKNLNPKIQKSKQSKDPKIQKSKTFYLHLRNLAFCFGFLDFFDFWIFGFFVFYTCVFNL